MSDLGAILADVEKACREGAQAALAMRPAMAREIKPDGSIVTDADRHVERMLRERIGRLTPGAPVWGEELGYQPPSEKGLWLLDPVDGTSNFAFGQPLWGVTASYFLDGRIRLGVIHIPELDWTFTALDGHGAHLNGKRMEKVKPGKIEPFELVGVGNLDRDYSGHLGKLRHLGAFVVEAGLFLTGGMRALVTNGVRMYDAAAGVVLAREVGAQVLELDGTPWRDEEWTVDVRCRPFGFFPPESGWPFRAQSQ